MSIYPKSSPDAMKVFVLTEEERKVLKAGFVTALEEEIKADQDKALRAVELSGFPEERILEIKQNLWQIFPLEQEVKNEVADDMIALEAAYKEGTTDSEALSVVIACEAVDQDIFADRFARLKLGEKVTDAVLPVKIIEKPLEGELGEGEAIIKPWRIK